MSTPVGTALAVNPPAKALTTLRSMSRHCPASSRNLAGPAVASKLRLPSRLRKSWVVGDSTSVEGIGPLYAGPGETAGETAVSFTGAAGVADADAGMSAGGGTTTDALGGSVIGDGNVGLGAAVG